MSATGKYIVVFKKSASDEAIDQQAEQVNENGGTVEKRFNSSILKGFTAEIPATYLLTLQSCLTAADSQIDYIGECHSTHWIKHDDIELGQCRTGLDSNHTMMREVCGPYSTTEEYHLDMLL
ncbi:hypothetical protein EDB89DRAFT_1941317 [Lactarius sanguifluus]|nr:hypothetical protein EDB89DRAFT_1941317 [Lactarius sanguifluus]